MPGRPLIILHGWSDNAESFKPLAQLIESHLNTSPQLISLADYITLDDEVTYDDLVTAMQSAWHDHNLPLSPFSIDAIVHSTGGLVIRDWLTRFFTPETSPIKHLVMLAPANFGSPLAHKGRSFIGRVLKGFSGDKLLNVGEQLLKGLELASPYTWQLAFKDRFSPQVWYKPDGILCTILIGNSGYSGISAAANEPGSDGTVRASCANLNCSYLAADFQKNPLQPTYQLKNANSEIAFGLMNGENHSTIAGKESGFKNPQTLPLILKALTLQEDEYLSWVKTLDTDTQTTLQQNKTDDYKHGFQNTVVCVRDQFNQHVTDYFMEFYEQNDGHDLADHFHADIIQTVHAYGDDTSFRSLHMDCTLLQTIMNQAWNELSISLTAAPEINQGRNVVGYRTYTDADIGAIRIAKNDLAPFFLPNRTLLTEIILRREQSKRLFEFQ